MKHPLYNKKFDDLNKDEHCNILVQFYHPNKKWLHKIENPTTIKALFTHLAFHLTLDWWMYGPEYSDTMGLNKMKAVFKKHKLLKEFE